MSDNGLILPQTCLRRTSIAESALHVIVVISFLEMWLCVDKFSRGFIRIEIVVLWWYKKWLSQSFRVYPLSSEKKTVFSNYYYSWLIGKPLLWYLVFWGQNVAVVSQAGITLTLLSYIWRKQTLLILQEQLSRGGLVLHVDIPFKRYRGNIKHSLSLLKPDLLLPDTD
jgi:hypothetical protein